MTEETQKGMMHPKCGGCGHNFFREPQIPVEQAMEQAKTRRCHYCIEDEEEAKKSPPRRYEPEEEVTHDGWW